MQHQVASDPNKPSLWDSEKNQEKTVALWKKLAERYVNEPWIGGYDILNEPNWGFTDYENDKNGLNESENKPLKKLYLDITAAIREVDQKHIIIIEGNGWGNNYNGMLPPWDNNMVISFHKYWNYNDDNSIKHILETREKYNVPVWLGETGENSNVWFTQAISLFERHNIGWAWWPLKKLGNNNPLQIRSNPGYEAILKYWQGKGPKPSSIEASRALFELGNVLKLEENIFHPDVIDAMMRQPHSRETKPFKKYTITGTTPVFAVDYDLGRNGIAYFDTDTANYWVSNGPRGGNSGRTYRNDGVDIKQDSVDQSIYYITDIEPGEWWQYTVEVPKRGTYKISISVMGNHAQEAASITINDLPEKKRFNIPAGAGNAFQNSNTLVSKLKNGTNTIRITAMTGGFNFRSITITPAKK
jgi:endoglucanase